ncbi:MAG: biopolymer transporter ExbD [Cyanobacteria bacterium]|nr:biopolymer transporter ExbD [Cyanobacteriota bacterium]MDA0866496.1 biopolymer transporter ExbD [Cyanobacteriota bacterium]
MHLPEEPESSAQINIVPMIDVIFVVLIFFILASLMLQPSEGLPVNLPEASTAEGPLPHNLTVTLTVDGQLSLGSQPVTLEQLPEAIQGRRVGKEMLLVVIQADAAVSHGQVVELMDTLRLVEGIQLGIATTQPSGVAP